MYTLCILLLVNKLCATCTSLILLTGTVLVYIIIHWTRLRLNVQVRYYRYDIIYTGTGIIYYGTLWGTGYWYQYQVYTGVYL